MTTGAEEIAAEGPYTIVAEHSLNTPWRIVGTDVRFSFSADANRVCTELNRAHAAAYKQGQQDRWIPVSQFKAPAPGQTILFGSKNTVRMWTWDANNDEPPSSWATHYRLIELPPNPDQP